VEQGVVSWLDCSFSTAKFAVQQEATTPILKYFTLYVTKMEILITK